MFFGSLLAFLSLELIIPQGGFEPPQTDPETAVLPLHNRGMCLNYKRLIQAYLGINAIELAEFCQGNWLIFSLTIAPFHVIFIL